MKKYMIIFSFVILIVPILIGCNADDADDNSSNGEDKTYQIVSTSQIDPGSALPPPSGPVVLTITGKIGVTNVEDTLQFDMEMLEKLELIEYKAADDEGLGREAVFKGVSLSHLFTIAQVSDDAETIAAFALNDYAVDIPFEDIENYPVMLAMATDGQPMSVEELGPIRVVYPNLDYEIDPNIANPRWIWQVKSFEIK